MVGYRSQDPLGSQGREWVYSTSKEERSMGDGSGHGPVESSVLKFGHTENEEVGGPVRVLRV